MQRAGISSFTVCTIGQGLSAFKMHPWKQRLTVATGVRLRLATGSYNINPMFITVNSYSNVIVTSHEETQFFIPLIVQDLVSLQTYTILQPSVKTPSTWCWITKECAAQEPTMTIKFDCSFIQIGCSKHFFLCAQMLN